MEWKEKAVTFSYDDGVTQDRRLVEMMNTYGVKGTFNLNSGIQSYTNVWEHSKGLLIRSNEHRRFKKNCIRDMRLQHIV